MNGTNGTRWMIRLVVLIILAVFLATTSLTIVSILEDDSPPLKFTSAFIKEPVVCGKTITYYVRVYSDDVPAAVMSVRTVYSVDRQRTVVWDVHPRYTVVLDKMAYEATSDYHLVDNLPPGNYQLRIAVQTQTSRSSVVKMDFVVPENCP